MEISEDTKTYLKKEIKNSIHTLHYLSELLSSDKLEDDMCDTLLANIENSLYDFNDILKRKSSLNIKKDKIYKEIKARNIEIRDLKQKISNLSVQKMDNQYFQNVVEHIYDFLYTGYRNKINCIVDFNIKNRYIIDIKLTPMISSYSHSFSKTPDTDKKEHLIKVENLRKIGFELNDNLDLCLTDNNIELLQNTIKSILPNARIKEIKNWTYKEENIIRSISFSSSLEDLINEIQ